MEGEKRVVYRWHINGDRRNEDQQVEGVNCEALRTRDSVYLTCAATRFHISMIKVTQNEMEGN